ncbi:MAG: MOSC domain-containing protein [Deltaproteobacteria bacterium]|nr:MOSC domain-containing protein [Deltaproteobacteria bacterium]
MRVGTVQGIWRYPVKSMRGEHLTKCRIETIFGIPGDRGWAMWDDQMGQVRNAKRLPGLLQCSARYLAEPIGASSPTVEVQLPGGEYIRTDDPEAATKLSASLGHELRFVPRQPAEDLEHYKRAERTEDLEDTVRIECGLLPDEPLPDFSDVPPELFQYVSPPGTYFDAFEIHALTTGSLSALSRLSPDSNLDARRFRPNLVIDSPEGTSGFPEQAWNGRELRIGKVRLRAERGMMRCAMVTWEQGDLPKDTNIMRTLVRETGHELGSALSVLAPGEVSIGDAVELID